MSTYLNSEKKLRFDTLMAVFATGDVSEEQEAELMSLHRELQNNKRVRAEQLSTIKGQVNDLNIAVAEIYSSDEISAAAQALNRNTTVASKSSNKKKIARRSRPSDTNEVLLVLHNNPGEKGPSEWRYRQGRVFERASDTTSLPWAMRQKQFPSKLLKVGTSAEALRPYFTQAGASYFATEAGQKELDRLVEVTNAARKATKIAD
jgi:hypothetical protein